jgi:hypothetical protein
MIGLAILLGHDCTTHQIVFRVLRGKREHSQIILTVFPLNFFSSSVGGSRTNEDCSDGCSVGAPVVVRSTLVPRHPTALLEELPGLSNVFPLMSFLLSCSIFTLASKTESYRALALGGRGGGRFFDNDCELKPELMVEMDARDERLLLEKNGLEGEAVALVVMEAREDLAGFLCGTSSNEGAVDGNCSLEEGAG